MQRIKFSATVTGEYLLPNNIPEEDLNIFLLDLISEYIDMDPNGPLDTNSLNVTYIKELV